MSAEISGGLQTDLIVAVATPAGQGGIGIVRLSGPKAKEVVDQLINKPLKPRTAAFCTLQEPTGDKANPGHVIDEGLVLWFPHGQSFTGEEVVEIHAHGSPVVLQQLLNCCCALGARLARPGEFTERAFLQGKLDLAQAEAVADLIASGSVAAARGAARSLRGDFSKQVNEIAEDLAGLRILVEACIDFPEEEVEHLQDAQVGARIEHQIAQLRELLTNSTQGRLVNEGAAVALLGAPNVGKSSLLNRLAGEEAAIVTDIPGTTRDLLKVDLVLGGVPLRLVDTAGLRPTEDVVEKIGVDRAEHQAREADLVIMVFAVDEFLPEINPNNIGTQFADLIERLEIPEATPVLGVVNKIDLLDADRRKHLECEGKLIWLSVKEGDGIQTLQKTILNQLGALAGEIPYTARARHIEALSSAEVHLQTAVLHLKAQAAAELVAEELRTAHLDLGEIVGTMTPDDLLGRIFSEFCIGK